MGQAVSGEVRDCRREVQAVWLDAVSVLRCPAGDVLHQQSVCAPHVEERPVARDGAGHRPPGTLPILRAAAEARLCAGVLSREVPGLKPAPHAVVPSCFVGLGFLQQPVNVAGLGIAVLWVVHHSSSVARRWAFLLPGEVFGTSVHAARTISLTAKPGGGCQSNRLPKVAIVRIGVLHTEWTLRGERLSAKQPPRWLRLRRMNAVDMFGGKHYSCKIVSLYVLVLR